MPSEVTPASGNPVMRRRPWWGFALLMLLHTTPSIPSFSEEPVRPLLRDYHGTEPIPVDLYRAYEELVAALARGDASAIEQLCLPRSVLITREERPTKERIFGEDINLPFARAGFHRYVLAVQRYATDTYHLRTASSYMYFVKTSTGGWKLYRYGDKPIE